MGGGLVMWDGDGRGWAREERTMGSRDSQPRVKEMCRQRENRPGAEKEFGWRTYGRGIVALWCLGLRLMFVIFVAVLCV